MSSDSEDEVDRDDLCLASRNGDAGLLSQLLVHHSFDADDATVALEQAKSDPAIFRMLLQHGADPSVVPLHNIRRCGAPADLTRLLAEYGYDFKSQGHYILQ
jgi:hypothetical protein